MEPWRHPNDRYLFLADLHLGADPGRTDEKLESDAIALIDHCLSADLKLILLGDIFDHWMEYGERGPEIGLRFREKLRQYNRQTGPTLYITGNHDNWTSSYFESIGCRVEPEHRNLPLGEQRALLLHGDGLSDPGWNLPRPVWHRILRSRTFVRTYQSLLPERIGWRLMATFADWNRDRGDESPDRLDRWARHTLEFGPYDFVICGHDHTPRIRHWTGGIYLNCGAFQTNRTAVRYTNGLPELVVWSAAERRLTPRSTRQTT